MESLNGGRQQDIVSIKLPVIIFLKCFAANPRTYLRYKEVHSFNKRRCLIFVLNINDVYTNILMTHETKNSVVLGILTLGINLCTLQPVYKQEKTKLRQLPI